jgi:hypothetical protein
VNFNPQNEQGILGLVAALKSGMSPDTAYGLFQGIQQDQASQIAARQERLGGLADLLMGAASQGTPYAGAEALADAAPGPMGPAVQQMLAALYPTGEQGPAPTNASGAQMDFPSGSRPGEPLAMAYGAPDAGPTAMSPTFVPQGPSPTEAIAMQEMEQQQAITADLTALQADAAAKKAEGWTLDQYLAAVQKSNPQLFAVAPDQARQVLEGTFGTSAYDMMGLQPSV